MKHASILLLAIGLCGLSFAACAEGDSTPFGNKPGDGEGGQGGKAETGGNGSGNNGPGSSSSSSSSSGVSSGDVCMATCKADTDCVAACPVPKVGVNCCDIGTSTCYVSGSTVCPSQGAGSSGGMYP